MRVIMPQSGRKRHNLRKLRDKNELWEIHFLRLSGAAAGWRGRESRRGENGFFHYG
jgi:hypothetical protein